MFTSNDTPYNEFKKAYKLGAINRKLPEIEIGDILVIHDTGAHGHAMGFNYNGKLRSAELLLKENGDVQLIRRAETIEDYFATLDFSKL